MQFLLLLLFNVFMGAVIYLLISLKLERSAIEFRQQKLRKEMDEIIQEFNATAERNISIMENRIKILRRLLEKSGDIKLLDVTVDKEDDLVENGGFSAGEAARAERASDKRATTGAALADDFPRRDVAVAHTAKKGLLLFFKKLMDILSFNKTGVEVDYENLDYSPSPRRAGEQDSTTAGDDCEQSEHAVLIAKMVTSEPPAGGIRGVKPRPLSDEEIAQIVSLATDKYSLVSVLFEKGCDIEDISLYSGIPVGEVRLVLNLNYSR